MTRGNPCTATSPCWHTDPESSSSKHTSSQLHQSAATNHNQQRLQSCSSLGEQAGPKPPQGITQPCCNAPPAYSLPLGHRAPGILLPAPAAPPPCYHSSGLLQSLLTHSTYPTVHVSHHSASSSHPLHALLSTHTGPNPRGSSSWFPLHLQYRHIHVPLGSIPRHRSSDSPCPTALLPTHSTPCTDSNPQLPRSTIPLSPPSTRETHTPCASPTTPKSPAHTYKPTNPIHLVPSTLYPINPTIPTCPTVLQHPYAHTSPQAAQFSVSQPHMHPNSKISPAHTPPFLLRSPTAPQPYIPHKSKLP